MSNLYCSSNSKQMKCYNKFLQNLLCHTSFSNIIHVDNFKKNMQILPAYHMTCLLKEERGEILSLLSTKYIFNKSCLLRTPTECSKRKKELNIICKKSECMVVSKKVQLNMQNKI